MFVSFFWRWPQSFFKERKRMKGSFADSVYSMHCRKIPNIIAFSLLFAQVKHQWLFVRQYNWNWILCFVAFFLLTFHLCSIQSFFLCWYVFPSHHGSRVAWWHPEATINHVHNVHNTHVNLDRRNGWSDINLTCDWLASGFILSIIRGFHKNLTYRIHFRYTFCEEWVAIWLRLRSCTCGFVISCLHFKWLVQIGCVMMACLAWLLPWSMMATLATCNIDWMWIGCPKLNSYHSVVLPFGDNKENDD